MATDPVPPGWSGSLSAGLALVVVGCRTEARQVPLQRDAATANVEPPSRGAGGEIDGTLPTLADASSLTEDAQAPHDVIIFDGTRPREYDMGSEHPPPRAPLRRTSPTEDRQVIGLFFRSGLARSAPCCQYTTFAQQVERGGDVPRVRGAVEGAFTQAGAHQVLYRLDVCDCSHADNYGTQMLAVMSDGVLVATAPLRGGSSIDKIFDLDGDGIAELFVVDDYGNNGTTSEHGRLVTFRGGHFSVIRDFGEIHFNDCFFGYRPPTDHPSIIHASTRPGETPAFRVEKKTRPCREYGPYTMIDPDGGMWIVDVDGGKTRYER